MHIGMSMEWCTCCTGEGYLLTLRATVRMKGPGMEKIELWEIKKFGLVLGHQKSLNFLDRKIALASFNRFGYPF
jgi:hypothetical protein